MKVKTFTNALEIFHAKKQLADLDSQVNEFLQNGNVKRVISVSDTTTTDDRGAAIGLIRVVAYE